MSINNDIANELTGHTIDLMRFDAKTRAEIRGVLKRLEDDLVRQINAISINEPKAQVYKLSRLERLLKQTRDTIRASYRKNRQILTDDLIEVAKLEVEDTLGVINAEIGVEVATTVVPPAQIRVIATKTLVEGAPSAEWWSRQAGSLRNRFADEMRMGLLQGETNQDLVRRVRGSATGRRTSVVINGKRRQVPEFSGGIMDVTTSQAEALVRTSVQTVANEARLETYQENDDVIKGYQALAMLDLRTSDICKARSGFAWDMEGDPMNSITTEDFPGPPPWHWNCRTTLTPILYSWDELTGKRTRGISEIPASTQASLDGQVADDITYEEWLASQTRERQIEALGPRRYKLWKEGKIRNFSELIDQTGRPRTIEQIKARRRR